jgi:chromosome segregation ATPase
MSRTPEVDSIHRNTERALLKQRAETAEADRDKWYSRCASLVWRVPSSVTAGEIQQWEADYQTELAKAEARVKELEGHLKGTMHAGGYEHFVEQLRNAQRQAHNAIHVAEQLEKKVEKLEALDELTTNEAKEYLARAEAAEARAKELEVSEAMLRDALELLLIGYEGLGGDMENNGPMIAKAALAETKGTT